MIYIAVSRASIVAIPAKITLKFLKRKQQIVTNLNGEHEAPLQNKRGFLSKFAVQNYGRYRNNKQY